MAELVDAHVAMGSPCTSGLGSQTGMLDSILLDKRPELTLTNLDRGLPRCASGKEPACQCRRHKRCGFDPGWGRSLVRGRDNPLQ